MFKISFASINGRKDMCDRELSHIFMGPGAVSDGFTGIKNALVKRLFILKWS
jgi:hypothetical protein